MSKIIILAVDGGGIKGVIPSFILKTIESKLSKKCYQMFDIIGGTSTGGIIAAALTSPINGRFPLSAQDVFNMYQNDGSKIFVSQTDFDNEAAYYANDGEGNGIEPYLQGKLGLQSLAQAKANMSILNGRTKHVFTTGYTINSSGNAITSPVLGKDYGPYLFNWQDAVSYPRDNYFIWEAARSSSAAPTYFPVASVGGGTSPNSSAAPRWVVDGGVMSNNPTIWAISEAFRTRLVRSLSDIIVISLGTGTYPQGAGLLTVDQGGTVPDNGNWGSIPWAGNDLYDLSGVNESRGGIVSIITEAVQLVSNQQVQSLVYSGLQYYRLEPVITYAQSRMDNYDPSNIASLITTTQNYLAGAGKASFDNILVALATNTADDADTGTAPKTGLKAGSKLKK